MKKNYVPFSPTRNFMKKLGAEIVSRDAVNYINQFIETKAREIASESLAIVKHSGRKKVKKEDILFVLNNKYKNIIGGKILNSNPSFMAFSPMRQIMMQEKCDVVAREAILLMNVFLEICIEKITKNSINLLTHIETRKKITIKDIGFVINDLFEQKVITSEIIQKKPKNIKEKLPKRSRKCAFCGNECSPNAKICPKCGDPFD